MISLASILKRLLSKPHNLFLLHCSRSQIIAKLLCQSKGKRKLTTACRTNPVLLSMLIVATFLPLGFRKCQMIVLLLGWSYRQKVRAFLALSTLLSTQINY